MILEFMAIMPNTICYNKVQDDNDEGEWARCANSPNWFVFSLSLF